MKDGDRVKLVEINNLRYSYPDGSLALDGINLSIERGRRVAILGANGSGKSTLLEHLNGLILPQEGEVFIDGIRLDKKSLWEVRRKLGLVFDNPDDQLFATTVFEDVAFGPRNLKLDEAKVREKVEEVLEVIGIIDLRDKQPHNLSLGQKRKAAIGGVLSMEPDILVFDEPFSGLDPGSLEQFIGILDRLYDLGHSLIVTTHDVDIAYSWADEIIIINKGRVLSQGGPELLEDEDLLKEANLRLPSLYRIFANTNIRVRNIDQAREQIDLLLARN